MLLSVTRPRRQEVEYSPGLRGNQPFPPENLPALRALVKSVRLSDTFSMLRL